jgi:hypothetical protein
MPAGLKDSVTNEDIKLKAVKPVDFNIPFLDIPLKVNLNIIKVAKGININKEIF